MALDIEEQHQVEQVKKWLAEYGITIIVVVVIAVIAMFAYQRFGQMRERALDHASVRYEQLLDYLVQNKTESADTAAAYLIKRYPRSDYAKLAELLLAKRDISENKLDDAKVKLQDVAEHGNTPAIKQIARLRLARLEIQQGNAAAALETLKKMDSDAYLLTIAAVKGDAYVALNQIDAARGSYQEALTGLPENAILHSLISMKLNNLPA